ncbi:MAG TPA: ABC transporter ATP-binding protein, partial [Spirochaetia bacterium]|nr:ABC transporter ATP-binding protein [Spirochaetia bacterium]
MSDRRPSVYGSGAMPSVPGMPGRGPGSGPGALARGAPVERPATMGRTLRRIWSYFGGERRWLLVVTALILVDSALGMAVPFLIGKGVDAIGALPGSPGSLVRSALGTLGAPAYALAVAVFALLAAYLGGALLQSLEGWLMAGVSQRMVRNVREGFFDKMQRLPLSFFDTRPHGDVMSRLTNDVDAVSVTVSQSAVQLMSGVVVVAGTLAIMIALNPIMAAASLLPVPLVFALTSSISRRTRRLYRAQQNALGALNGHIEETVSGIQAVKAFGREPESRVRFAQINETLRHDGARAQIWTGFLMPMMNVIGNLGFAAVAVTGGLLAAHGMISVGLIATFIAYSRQFGRPLNDIANTWNSLMAAVAGAERVFEVMDDREEPADAAGARELVRPRGEVEFRGVSFGYRPDVTVLKGIDLKAPSGSVTAIVGRTGAGKTTIVNLLCRFYETSGGEILIDGTDIRQYTRASLRRAFAVVLQDGWLFSGSVRDNILYGRPGASEEEMRHAAALAGADHAIERLQDGYDTMLVESGANLSQGQRQLI